MAITKQKKAELLSYLTDRLEEMEMAVFVRYRGMTVESINNLRSMLFKQGMNMKVAKKTIMKRAFEEKGITGYDSDMLDGPTAIAFGYEDVVSLAKLLKNFAKEEENLSILGGVLEGKVVDKDTVLQLADLPSREELIAKLIGSMQSPISGFTRSAKSPINGFVTVLRSLRDKSEA